MTDTKWMMPDSQTLRQSTSWLSAGEGHSDGTAYHSAIRKEHVERKMPIGKQKDYAVEVQGEERKKRLGMFGYRLSC